jgi:hypothetical protein
MQYKNSDDKAFYWLAAIAAFLTVGTNLYIHLTDFEVNTLEERIALFQNKAYLTNRIIISLHCILVIISSIGMGMLLKQYSRGFATLGMLSFIVFGLTEISRMLFSLNYVNGLRESYFNESNAQVKEWYVLLLTNAAFINNIFFRLFILAFAFGLVCFGIALLLSPAKSDKRFGIGILVLAAITFLSFVNDFYESPVAGKIIHWGSITLQPFIRAWMGIWILNRGVTPLKP